MCNVPVAGITLFNFEQEKGLVILQYSDFMVSQGHIYYKQFALLYLSRAITYVGTYKYNK